MLNKNINRTQFERKKTMINLTKNEQQLTDEMMSKINLSKDKEVLGGHVVSLSKTIIDLSKKADVDLGAIKAQVVAVIDYSGSMSRMYRNGTVQDVINKLLPVGLTFDDNGSVEVFRFDDYFKQLESLDAFNYSNYVNEFMMNGSMGCTQYAPVLKEIKKQYIGGEVTKKGLFGFGKKTVVVPTKADTNPVFVIFITDGDNSDKRETDEIIRELSNHNCFIQFIGVGGASMSYLEKLDDLDGRACDNTGFERFNDIEHVNSAELYNKVLSQFADWLKVKGF